MHRYLELIGSRRLVLALGGFAALVSFFAGCGTQSTSPLPTAKAHATATTPELPDVEPLPQHPTDKGSSRENVGHGETTSHKAGLTPDFDQAIAEVHFRPSTDENGRTGPNGIPDSVEMALIARVLSSPELDFSAQGGLNESIVRAAWEQAHMSATRDVAQHLDRWPHLATLVAGYVLVGTDDSFQAIQRRATSFDVPLDGNYTLARTLGRVLGPDGDADGDGFTNRQEFHAFGQHDREAYLTAALDPAIAPSAEQLGDLPELQKTRYTVGLVLFEGFELLDVYGPAGVWGNIPEFELFTVAETRGSIRSAQGLETQATYTFQDAPPIDVLLVPGGPGVVDELENANLLAFLQTRHATTSWTTSVCTGSALLAKAGLLDELKATSNKAVFYLASRQSQRVHWIEQARWVEDGKVFTSSGVSAGTDMALALVNRVFGLDRAKRLAEQLEYQWHQDPNSDPFAYQLRR